MKSRILSLFSSVAVVVILLVPQVQSQDVKAPIRAALDRGDTTLAISLINEDIQVDKGYHINYYTLGSIYYAREQYETALEKFQQALDKKKKHYESLYMLGMTQLALGDLEAAKKTMEEGLKKDRKRKDRFEDGLGLVLLEMEDYAGADKAFRRALVEDDENAEYHIHLGDANFHQGIPALAIAEYERALELDTAGKEVYFHWAEACLDTRDYACAIEKLRIVLSKDSTYAPAWRRAGGIYFKAARSSRDRTERSGRFRDAIGSYQKYVQLSNAQPDSSNVRVFLELAMSYVELYGFEDAAQRFEEVLSIPYEPRDIYFYYGKALWGTKDYARAAEMLLKHIDWVENKAGNYKTSARDWELYQLLGDCYYYLKPEPDFANAVLWYKKSLADRPDQRRIVQNTAVALDRLRSYREAITYYEKRIDMGLDSTSSGVLKYAGYCALKIANNEAEGDDDDMLLEEDGMEEEAVVDTVNYYSLSVSFLERYLQTNPADEKVLELVANTVLYQLADCNRGVQYFEQLLQLNPNSCIAMRSLGYAYFGGLCNKDYNKALRYLTRAQSCIAATPEGAGSDVPLMLWIAQVYHLRAAEVTKDKADFKNAFDWYGKVLKYEPNNTDAIKGQDDTRFEF